MINPEHYLQFKRIYVDYVRSLFANLKNNNLIFLADNEGIANYLYVSLPRDRSDMKTKILQQETRLGQFPISRSITKGDVARLQRLTDAKNNLKDIENQINAIEEYYLINNIPKPINVSKLKFKAMFNGFIQRMLIETNLNLAKLEKSIRGDWKADFANIMNIYDFEDSKIEFSNIENLSWVDVTITFFNDENIQVTVGNESKNFEFFEIGFRDNRVRKYPKTNNSWSLLQAIAINEGIINWKKNSLPININRNMKKYIQSLRKLLKAFIGIEEDPFFHYDRPNKGWKTKFKISHRFVD